MSQESRETFVRTSRKSWRKRDVLQYLWILGGGLGFKACGPIKKLRRNTIPHPGLGRTTYEKKKKTFLRRGQRGASHEKFHAAPSKKQARFLEGPLSLRT